MPLTLIAPPGLSDLPDSALNAEEIAQGQHAVKILENTKFGVVRPEFFYMGRFSDGQTVARPVSKVDRLPYQASEVIYLWEVVLSADPRDGITSGAGTMLYFDYQVDQKDKPDPGLVHCKTVYHVQGGQTTETQDGELSVWAIGIRGLDQLDLAAIPAWTNVPDANFDLDSAWREDRLKDLNAAAKRSVVQAEFFDLGEFGNGQTVPQPVSDVDGFTYPYADLVFLTSWRWTPAFATGITSGPSGATLARLEKNVNGANGLVDTTVTYRFGASSDTVTQDGRVRVFAFGFRAGITATGTVSFTDLNANVFLPGKKALDDDALVMVRNSKFAALRPEFFVTTQAHGTTVPLPTSPVDGYAYARAELIYLYARSDTAAPGSIGSLLTLHGFIRQDTGAVTLNTLYFRQGGAQTNTNNGTFRVVTVGLRSKDVEVDSDPTAAGGGEPGFGGLPAEVLLTEIIANTQNLLMNPSVENEQDFWKFIETNGGQARIITTGPTTAHTGNNYLRLDVTSAGDTASAFAADQNGSQKFFEVTEDDVVIFGGWALVATGAFHEFRLSWYDEDKVLVSSLAFAPSGASWTRYVKTKVIPVGAKYISLRLAISFDTAMAGARYDDLFLGIAVPDSRFINLVNTANGPTTQPLTQSGTSTTILVASSTYNFGFGSLSYNSGSVNPGSYGTWYVKASDKGYNGGGVTYEAVSNPADITNGEWIVYFGKITTSSGGGGSGGGGGGGPCLTPETLLSGEDGNVAAGSVRVGNLIDTKFGLRLVLAVEEIDYEGEVALLPAGARVTPNHHFELGETWVPTGDVFAGRQPYVGKVYNFIIEGTANYRLANGLVLHNALK